MPHHLGNLIIQIPGAPGLVRISMGEARDDSSIQPGVETVGAVQLSWSGRVIGLFLSDGIGWLGCICL